MMVGDGGSNHSQRQCRSTMMINDEWFIIVTYHGTASSQESLYSHGPMDMISWLISQNCFMGESKRSLFNLSFKEILKEIWLTENIENLKGILASSIF